MQIRLPFENHTQTLQANQTNQTKTIEIAKNKYLNGTPPHKKITLFQFQPEIQIKLNALKISEKYLLKLYFKIPSKWMR